MTERTAQEIEELKLQGRFAEPLEERYNACIDEMVAFLDTDWNKKLDDGFLNERFNHIVSRRVTLWASEMNRVLSETGSDMRVNIRYNSEEKSISIDTRHFE